MALTMKVKFRDSEFRRDLSVGLNKINKTLLNESIRFVKKVQETVVKPATPVGKGRLRRSISVRVDKRFRTRTVITMQAGKGKRGVPYAPFVEFGTRRHIIRPLSAQYLRFPGTHHFKGETIFTKLVKHPGMKGRRMFRKGMRVIQTQLPKRLRDKIRKTKLKSSKRGRRRA